MGRKLNPNIHIICGKCGCATMLSYHLTHDIDDDTNTPKTEVVVVCDNCGTITYLSEIMEENNN